MSLPKELNFTDRLQALPSSTKTISVVVSPNNGSEFNSGGEIISFDLPSRGYLVPNSMYLRYRQKVVKATEAGVMLGVPAYTPFSRIETIIGAQVVESIQDYNQVCNMVINTKLNHAQKVGISAALGFLDATTTPTYENMNGCTIAVAAEGAAAGNYDRAMPLGCLLSNCENLFPLGLAPAVRINLTTEALATQFATPTTAVTSAKVSRLELCFDIIEFGSEIDAVVKSMADEAGNLIIKSQSYSTSNLNVPATSSGTLELTYNQRISSIKSIFALFSSTSKGSKKFGAKDITKSLGDYQFYIGSEAYPPRPLSSQNKAGMLLELAQSWSNANSIDACNMSITRPEYGFIDNEIDTGYEPAKFYVGCNTERLSSNSAILTGISSQLSPISLRINFGGSTTTDTHSATLVTVHDALILVNVVTRQATVKT